MLNKDIKIIDLGFHPFADTFIKKKQLNFSEPIYHLACYLNKKTGIIRNGITTDAHSRYNMYDYSYTSSNSNFSKQYWQNYAKNLIDNFNINKRTKILEIGSNDGYLLKNLNKKSKEVYGVDASKFMCNLSKKNKIKTFNFVFNKKNSFLIKKKLNNFDFIIANNVLNHSDNVVDFIKGVKNIIKKDGIFIFELPYWYNLVINKQFDQIYHEHVNYFTVKSSQYLLNKCGMEIIKIEETSYHGGSIKIFSRIKKGVINSETRKYIKKETEAGLFKEKTYKKLMLELNAKKKNFVKKIIQLKEKKYKIIGMGAPAKGNTFLNFLKLDNILIDFITDNSKFKINKYTPLSRIPIKSDKSIKKLNGKICIIFLSWNLEKILKPKLKKLKKNFIFLNFFKNFS